jgi:nucleoside phosphorylase
MPSNRKLSHDDYTVAWICALPVEMAAAQFMLDEVHEDLPTSSHDHNSYTLGRIGKHNVVIAGLPHGRYGNTSATGVVRDLLASFDSIRFGLMVGIGGGIPNSNADIQLGDIVVSKPTGAYGGVVQYDYGKALKGCFARTGMLNQPPSFILTALTRLQAKHMTEGSQILKLLSKIEEKLSHIATNFTHPGQEDRLYQTDYDHIGESKTCERCDHMKTVPRVPRKYHEPVVHYGLIASGNSVVKNSEIRDWLSRELGVYCVETEAAGLMNNFPCVVIRGISDYADSHKNDEWQGYAAATAAAYAKELLTVIHEKRVTENRASLSVTHCKLLPSST